jgi:hypothetical protein
MVAIQYIKSKHLGLYNLSGSGQPIYTGSLYLLPMPWHEVSLMERSSDVLSRLKLYAIPFAAYGILSVILTYPVAFSGDMLPGGGDAYQFLWFYWLFKKSLLSMSNPYYTDYVFYPNEISLVFSDVSPLNSISSVPLQFFFSLITTYKIIWMLTFILSGFTMYLLAYYLIKDRRAAFISGIIFTFCPYHFAHALGHINLIAIEWIPLYLLFLMRAVREGGSRNAIYAGLFLALNAASSLYYLLYMFIFTFIFLTYHHISERSVLGKETIRQVGIMGATFLVMTSPLIYLIGKELLTARSNYMYVGGFVSFSGDLAAYFIPSLFNPILGQAARLIYATFSNLNPEIGIAEMTIYAGYTVIILSLIALTRIKGNDDSNDKNITFLGISAGIFALLSLGPLLHVMGLVSSECEGYVTYIPLPYLFLMKLPIFSLLRVTSRWDVLVMLSLALLAGYGAKYIVTRHGGSRSKENLILVLISCLILFEFLSVPYPLAEVNAPEFYSNLAKEEGNFTIMELPNYDPELCFPEYMYYQTIHGKKLIGGYVGRAKINHYPPFISYLWGISMNSVSRESQDILNQNSTILGAEMLNYLNIKYVLLHSEFMNKERSELMEPLLRSISKGKPRVYGSMVVYEVKEQPITQFLYLDDGWFDKEVWGDGALTRWAGQDAGIIAVTNRSGNAKLSFITHSFNIPRTMNISVNGNPAGLVESIGIDFVSVQGNISLNKGRNLIEFHSEDGSQRPSDVPGSNSEDHRLLSFAIRNITLDMSDGLG